MPALAAAAMAGEANTQAGADFRDPAKKGGTESATAKVNGIVSMVATTTPTANPGVLGRDNSDATVRTSITSYAHVDKIYDKRISNSPSPCNPKFACDEYISRISPWLQDRAKLFAEISVQPRRQQR
jgi:hypothetical protein